MSGEHPVRPIDRGDDWVELEADNSWIPPGSRPSKPSGSESHNMSAAANSATSPLPFAPNVEVDAEPDEEVPRHDDEDAILFPELIKSNPHGHTFPPGGGWGKEKSKLAKVRWVADAILDWMRETPTIGPIALHGKLFEKYKINISYMKIFYAKERALDKINGPWNESFQLLYTFKAEVETTSPGSVVEIDKHTVKPYLAVDATALNGRWRGQLAATSAVDGHNWLFPVAFGVLEVESEESWVWFLQQLRNIIGTPSGLVIHIDAFKGLETTVEIVFPGVEHRECMRHLAQNFKKKFRGKVYDENLWPASYTCNLRKHEHHLRVMYAHNPLVKEYMDAHHGKLWSRSKFNEICKVDYVTNNLAECFNAKFKSVKGLLLWQAFDKIRQMIMIKMALRKRITETQYVGHLMLPSLIKAWHANARGLRMKCILPLTYEAEVTYTNNKNREWRYPVNLATNECSCRQWQIRGKPCIHALHLMTVIGGEDGEVDQYCSEYFSVAKFRAAYAENVPALLGKDQWNIVDPGFKLCSPVLTRPPGRPRKNMIRAGEEGRVKKQRKCKRCGILGHIARRCTNPVDASFGEEEQWAAKNAKENAAA
ncbi:uncharacterized protein [Aegilops tauschii subsp. strangulata]|uniref:uncharacterized protein n=1 Tax=Aegilops tauschii subsp. strangulata TaxID=200361 RepID=UPI00098B6097|nr:uncharacterized protein LOC109771031 [Aegilops tauschii subsp. strangulata]